jgi:hypothetical protein
MVARSSRSIGFVVILIIAMILLTGFGNPFPHLEVAITNNRDEIIIIYAKPFDYLITSNPLKIQGSYVFEYFGMNSGIVHLGTYDDYPCELPGKLTYPCYVYPSDPWSYAEGKEWWPGKPVEEHFKLVYEEFIVYDIKGNEILSLETLTNANFIKKMNGTDLYDWYLIIE